MKIYKYLHEDRIEDILENNIFRFTQPEEFNDPFELRPVLRFPDNDDSLYSTLDDNFESILMEEYKKNSDINTKITFESFLAFRRTKKKEIKELAKSLLTSKEFTKRLNETHYKTANKSIGILCLTKNYNNLLMWAHYANSHKGFVVGLDSDNSFFKQDKDDKNLMGKLKKVIYNNERPSESFENMNVENAYLTKSKEWSYEEEYRMFTPFKRASQIKNDNIYLYNFTPDAIVSIYCGVNMSEENKEKIKEIVAHEHLQYINLFQSEISEQHFKLEFNSIIK